MASSVPQSRLDPMALSRKPATVAATAAIVSFMLMGAVLGGWMMSVAYVGFATMPEIGATDDRMVPSGVIPTAALMTGILAAAVVLTVFVRQIRPRSVNGRALLPAALHRRLRRIHELSMFGVGDLRAWSAHNPSVALTDIPPPASPAWIAGLTGGALGSPSTGHPVGSNSGGSLSAATPTGRRHPPAPIPRFVPDAGIVVDPDTMSRAATRPGVRMNRYIVDRGDTLWTLAERLLGGGARWAELRDLNIGREVAPGVVFEPGASLRNGWELAVPVAEDS